MDVRPVFVCAPHRSGSTMLMRVLNCHPELVIWGEHGGFLNQLAEMDAVMTRTWNIRRPIGERDLESYIAQTEAPSFDAWTNPVDIAAFRRRMADLLDQTFSAGLSPQQRWGLKEIRYGGPAFARYLLALFPAARILILRRDPLQLCISNILASWSLEHLGTLGVTDEQAEDVVADCAYAVTAIDWRLQRMAEVGNGRVRMLWLKDVAHSIDDIFKFSRTGCGPGDPAASGDRRQPRPWQHGPVRIDGQARPGFHRGARAVPYRTRTIGAGHGWARSEKADGQGPTWQLLLSGWRSRPSRHASHQHGLGDLRRSRAQALLVQVSRLRVAGASACAALIECQ